MSEGRPKSGSVGRAPVAGVELEKAICDYARTQCWIGNCAPIAWMAERMNMIAAHLGHDPALLGSTKQITAMLKRLAVR